MLKRKVKIYHDGSQFVATVFAPALGPAHYGPREKNLVYEKFKKYYAEAAYKRITEIGKKEYIQGRFVDSAEDICEDIPSFEEIEKMWKQYAHCLHLRNKRFKRKAYLNGWSWWTTFTYSDDKITADEFEHQIRTKLSDLSSHKGWRYMLRWEEGELYERKHLHAILYVPEGAMIGEMFTDSHYSHKKRKTVTFTNNTYFASRFGTSYWVELKDGKVSKQMLNYMLKYMSKNDGKIIYSRGIPDELEAVIDLEEDSCAPFYDGFASKCTLFSKLFLTSVEHAKMLSEAFDLEGWLQAEPIPI